MASLFCGASPKQSEAHPSLPTASGTTLELLGPQCSDGQVDRSPRSVSGACLIRERMLERQHDYFDRSSLPRPFPLLGDHVRLSPKAAPFAARQPSVRNIRRARPKSVMAPARAPTTAPLAATTIREGTAWRWRRLLALRRPQPRGTDRSRADSPCA